MTTIMKSLLINNLSYYIKQGVTIGFIWNKNDLRFVLVTH